MNRPNPHLPPVIKTISVADLAKLCAERLIDLVDVRTPEEFAEVRAIGARNVPLDTIDPPAVVAAHAAMADQPLYFICKVGGRSAYACQMFTSAGYPNVVNVEGGTDAWLEAVLPVERGEVPPAQIEFPSGDNS